MVNCFELICLPSAVIVAEGMVKVPSFWGRKIQVKVNVFDEVRTPFTIDVLEELD